MESRRLLRLLQFVMVALGVLISQSYLSPAYGENVIPKDNVRNHVNVRELPSGSSNRIGILRPGEHLDYLESVPRWHKVRMKNGQEGFVSKSWTVVVPDIVDLSDTSPFVVHFLDVGTGDSTIIDIGDREIIIDGGDSTLVLNAYANRAEIVDGPVELVVVPHGDTDQWRGLSRFLGFDGVGDETPDVLEFWDPGYNRDCNPPENKGRKNYLKFIKDMESLVGDGGFFRPLENKHKPADISGQVEPFPLGSVPGVTITLLHSDSSPAQGSCSYKINNASIVMMLEIGGIRFLFTGDANGKKRNESAPGTPKHVEAKLLDLNNNHPGLLKADVLKVPHHGSETTSTQAFIDAVDPKYVIISGSTRHHLTKDTVIERYRNG